MEDADVVLFYGPPLVGKSSHYRQHLSSSHVRLSAQELFQEDQTLSLRQVAMRAVGLLREGKKVVIDDENWSRNTRMSYTKLLSYKTPGKSIRCLKFHPQDKLQLNWAREWATLGAKVQGSQVNWKQVDAKIDAWFDENCWQRGVERPVPPAAEAEGLSIDELHTQLTCQTHYKFEVPCLLVQWEAMVQSTGGRLVLRDNILDILQLWTEANPCGHIVIIVDGQNNMAGTHGSTSSQQTIHLKSVMTSLCQEFTENVVYFVQIVDVEASGPFSRPPEPGLLSWLQLRHRLNLFHQSSLYIWQSPNHRRSAEAVGMRNIGGDRLVARPRMVLLVPKSVNAEIPTTLQSMKLVTLDTPAPPPSIPLYQEALKHCQLGEGTSSTPQVCYITKNVGGVGRVHGVCFKDLSVLEKVQGLYRDNAAMLEEPKSKIEEMCGRPVVVQPKQRDQEDNQESRSSTVNEKRSDSSVSSTTKTKRTIPQWMLPKTERKRSPEDAQIKELSVSPGKRKRKSPAQANRIEYCMSEAELVQMAEQILQKTKDQSVNNGQEDEDLFPKYQNHHGESTKKVVSEPEEEAIVTKGTAKSDAMVKEDTNSEVKVDTEVTQLLDDIFTTGRRKCMMGVPKPSKTRNVKPRSRGQDNEIETESQGSVSRSTLTGIQDVTDQEASLRTSADFLGGGAKNGYPQNSPVSSFDHTTVMKTDTDTDFSFLDSIIGEKRVVKKKGFVNERQRYGAEDVSDSEEPFLDSIIYSKRREWEKDSSVVDTEQDTSSTYGGNSRVCSDSTRSPWKKNPKTQQQNKNNQSIDRLSFLDNIVSGKKKGEKSERELDGSKNDESHSVASDGSLSFLDDIIGDAGRRKTCGKAASYSSRKLHEEESSVGSNQEDNFSFLDEIILGSRKKKK